jgi:hypothetical protein
MTGVSARSSRSGRQPSMLTSTTGVMAGIGFSIGRVVWANAVDENARMTNHTAASRVADLIWLPF